MNIEIAQERPGAMDTGIVELWNAAIGEAFPLDIRLYRQQVAPGATTSALFVARYRDSAHLGAAPLGAALAKIAPSSWGDDEKPGIGSSAGFLSFIVVSRDRRRDGLGGTLLNRAEAWCRDHGAASIHIGSDYRHFFPGLPIDDSAESKATREFFEKRGYVSGNIEHDLEADLRHIDLGPSAEVAFSASGYRFSLCGDELRPAALSFLSKTFPGRWHREIVEAFDAGMRGSDLALALSEKDGLPVGFARICVEESACLSPGLFWRGLLGDHPGALGPIGIAPSCRGRGLGLALLRGSLASLKSRGVRRAVIDWTDLEGFYGKLGFAPWKTYLGMTKRICSSRHPDGAR
ncbi:MAG TPA: GNAT family N-acetyltransferase [Rectinemataceae bacterium]|nr:GNAT family N-acetyltransferase [Rectinemataceae bacterium]